MYKKIIISVLIIAITFVAYPIPTRAEGLTNVARNTLTAIIIAGGVSFDSTSAITTFIDKLASELTVAQINELNSASTQLNVNRTSVAGDTINTTAISWETIREIWDIFIRQNYIYVCDNQTRLEIEETPSLGNLGRLRAVGTILNTPVFCLGDFTLDFNTHWIGFGLGRMNVADMVPFYNVLQNPMYFNVGHWTAQREYIASEGIWEIAIRRNGFFNSFGIDCGWGERTFLNPLGFGLFRFNHFGSSTIRFMQVTEITYWNGFHTLHFAFTSESPFGANALEPFNTIGADLAVNNIFTNKTNTENAIRSVAETTVGGTQLLIRVEENVPQLVNAVMPNVVEGQALPVAPPVDGALMDILREIRNSVRNLPNAIIDGMTTMFQNLFVPSETFFQDNFDELQDELRERLPYQIYIDTFGQLRNMQTALDMSATTRALPITHATANATNLSLDNPEQYISMVTNLIRPHLNAIRNVVGALYGILLALFNYRQLLWLIRGTSPISIDKAG
ncbi:MAG: hypothetical protein FWC16_03415 [Defluviitaleaceae bacterium]|nr:hypothetical protein [Defluviitaleaceae bacterium]MCL2273951.1 hypothetical protein [Defluviitaleaceae bacterium]